MPDYQHVLLEKDSVEHIAKLTLNRPDRLNALNDLMIDEIGDAVENVSGDDSMRVLILTGAGRAFCSGGDRRLLSKNPGFTPKIESLRHSFPDARFIYMVRNPLETIGSMQSMARQLAGFDEYDVPVLDLSDVL